MLQLLPSDVRRNLRRQRDQIVADSLAALRRLYVNASPDVALPTWVDVAEVVSISMTTQWAENFVIANYLNTLESALPRGPAVGDDPTFDLALREPVRSPGGQAVLSAEKSGEAIGLALAGGAITRAGERCYFGLWHVAPLFSRQNGELIELVLSLHADGGGEFQRVQTDD